MKNLIFIVGETAVGKTDLALNLAKLVQSKRKLPAGILNADSVQIYKELNIGSAKPDFSSRPDINFYLFNELSAPQLGTAALFRARAFEILKNKIFKETIFLTGGSGFYLQALEKGMYPVQAQDKLSSAAYMDYRQKAKDTKELYQELEKKDIETAQKISPNDRYRISRALDLMKKEGKTASQVKREFKARPLPWPYLKIGLRIPKEELLKRVQKRVRDMLKKGLVEETQSLIDKGFKSWKPLSSVGYKEAVLYLEARLKKEDLEAAIVSKTMQLAKKQRTWFKKDKSIQWLDWNLPALKVYKHLFK